MPAPRTRTKKTSPALLGELARKLHPDLNPGDADAESRFKEINAAHDVLSDEEKRAKYDRHGENWEQAEAFEKARAQYASQGGGAQSFTFDINDLLRRSGRSGGGGGGIDFGDMLGNLFRGGSRGPTRGQNVEYVTEITLEEAFQGTTRTLNLQGEESCGTCGGGGEIAGAVCHECQGAGSVARPKRIEVKIPAGARDGTRVRIAGEGSPGMGAQTGGRLAGSRGDLYVVTKVRRHRAFERKGDDLTRDVSVPVEDAVLGGEVEIETLAGKRIAVKVPAMTQNGTQIKLTGLGMPKLAKGKKKAGNGDLYARVRITIPEELSDEQRELFEKLREANKAPAGKAQTGKAPAEAKA
ncbi:MAG: J domain-containing protein [Chloroflexi bacterium]|nr:J domain-containing protein [Chloroflexota bacterium]